VGGTFGAATIIAGLAVRATCFGPVLEGPVDRLKDLVDDKAGQGWRKGVTLGESILLDEEVEGSVRSVEKTVVWIFIH
jgi:hypothetical protein